MKKKVLMGFEKCKQMISSAETEGATRLIWCWFGEIQIYSSDNGNISWDKNTRW